MEDFSKKGPKESIFRALKEHVLGSLQRRDLAQTSQTSRRERTFSIGRNYLDFVNKIKLLG